jgi:hypothetical protein
MTAEASKNPLSIDYTSRDYYSIRQQLIARVKERTNDQWQGTDPNDFGLALVEAFAYMGDTLNYYIDRLANESYILTATQRSTLLNIARMYGYTPAGYVSAVTEIAMTNNNGYKGLVGAAIIEDGTVGSVATTNISKLIVPNDHPFSAVSPAPTGKFNVVKVEGVANNAIASNVLGGKTLRYTTSVYNGTFPVISTGYNNIGSNVVWFKPQSTISSIAVSGTTMTVTAAGSLSPLKYQKITISGVTKSGDTGSAATSALNGTWTVTSDTASGVFTIDTSMNSSRITKVIGNGTIAVYSIANPNPDNVDNKYPSVWNDFVVNQKINIANLAPSGFNGTGATVTAVNNQMGILTNATVVTGTPNKVEYVSSVPVTVGQMITVSDVQSLLNPSATQDVGFNLTDVVVDSTSTQQVSITNVTPSVNGLITFEVSGGFPDARYFKQYQYVTITGVANTTTTSGPTNVYNMSAVRIESVSTTGFTVSGFWTDPYDAANSTTAKATVYSFLVKANVTDTQTSQGSIYSHTFTISNGTANQTSSVTAINPTYPISAASITTTTVTYTSANKLSAGDSVTISGITAGTNATAFNLSGIVSATGLSLTSFQVTVPTTFVASGGTYTSAVVTVTSSAYNTYVGTNSFTVGNLVTVTGATTQAYNVTGDTAVIAVTDSSSYFKVAGFYNGATSTASATSYPTFITGTGGTAVAAVTADRVSGGVVDYSKIPAVITGGYVYNLGATTIPKGAQITGQISDNGTTKSIIFTTLSDNVIDFRGSANVNAMHGEDVSVRAANLKNTALKAYDIDGELVGTSTGLADQSFALSEIVVHTSYAPGLNNYINYGVGDIRVFVDNGIEYEEWERVEYTMDSASSDKVFAVNVDENDKVQIKFGDGISGAIPPMSASIKAQYVAGGGVIGNVPAGTLAVWGALPVGEPEATAIRNNVAAVNLYDATGGVDPESNDSIRYNAPRAMRSLNRAVTLQDYADLALSVGGVAKAKAIADHGTSVTVYIAPISPDTSNDVTPGYTGDILSANLVTLKSSVTSFLNERKQIGTTVTVVEPKYVPVSLNLQYSRAPQYSATVVEDNLKKAIINDFSYNNMVFGDVLTPEEIEFKLRQVDGIINLKVLSVFRSNGSGRNSLVGSPNEIFYFDGGSITLTSASTISTVSALTVTASGGGSSTVTLTPGTWKSNVYSYVGTLPAGTTSVTVTPTAQSEIGGRVTSTLAVNSSITASGVASTSIPVVAGSVNTVLVTGTAQDGVTVTAYRLSLS